MKKQTLLITGSSGFIGSSFIESIGVKRRYILICPSHDQMDVNNWDSLERVVLKHKPDTIINFAAHRNANTAESQRDNKNGSAWMSNVEGVKNLVKLSEKYGIYLIHISTDMVFSGSESNKGPYSEEDVPENDQNKLSWYGWTKRLAEKEIISSGIVASIVRIGNVTKPVYNQHLDYVGKILWLHDNSQSYPLFNDQFITITYIPEMTRLLVNLIKTRQKGIFHVASIDLVSPFELAKYLIFKSRDRRAIISQDSIDRFLQLSPNRYPKFSGLKTKITQRKFGIKFKTWRQIVNNFIRFAS